MFIFSNLAVSLDGKISTATQPLPFLGTPEDRKQMQALRSRCDAILVGASNFRAYKKPLLVESKKNQPLNLVVSSALVGISPDWDFFKKEDLSRLFFVTSKAPTSRIRKFSKTCEIVLLKNPTKKNPVASQIIQVLEKKGIKNLLVEGGGGVMWDFVNHNLIDEYHVTMTPKLLGGVHSPTLVDGKGFLPSEIVNLKLRQCRIVGNELYLTYQKTEKRGLR